jgi:hypothetical protein
MRANEILSEVTDPKATPPKPNDPEFQKSKESFVKIINQAVAEYNAQLSNLRKTYADKYKEIISDNDTLVDNIKDAIFSFLINKGNGLILDADKDLLNKTFNIKLPPKSPNPTVPPVTPGAPSISSPPPKTPSEREFDILDLDNTSNDNTKKPKFKVVNSGKEPKQNSLIEGIFQIDRNTGKITIDPKDIDKLAKLTTFIWYRNRNLKNTNPTVFAKQAGVQSTGRSLTNRVNNNALAKAVGVDPQNPEFLQSLVNAVAKKDNLSNFLEKVRSVAGIKPQTK